MNSQSFQIKRKFPIFNRIDKESGDHIAQKIYEKYKNDDNNLDQNSVKQMIQDAYKIINKDHNADQEEIEHYIDHFSQQNQSYLTLEDIKLVCQNQLVGPKGYGINILNKNFQEEENEESIIKNNIKAQEDLINEENYSSISKQQTCKSFVHNLDIEKKQLEDEDCIQNENISQIVKQFKKQKEFNKSELSNSSKHKLNF